MGIFDKAKDALQGHEDKVDQGIERGGDLVDERTGGQHSEHVDRAQEMATEHFGTGAAGEPAGDPAQENEPPASNI